MKFTKNLCDNIAFHAELQTSQFALHPCMLNAVRRLRTVLDGARAILEPLGQGILLFLSADDTRVLMSLRALILRQPLWKVGVAAQAELSDLLDQV